FRRGRALPARLRIRAGLCLRRADGRGGGGAVADGTPAGSGELVALCRRAPPVTLLLREPHRLAVRHPRGLKTRDEAGFALRHLDIRAARGVPPGGTIRGTRQGRADDLLDLFK